MIDIQDLHTYYGDSHILRGIEARIPTAASVGLLGRNGMGKTTLIRSLMGYVRPTRGSVRCDGASVTGWAPEKMARLGIGYVPEGRGIFPNLSVRENLLMPARAGVDGRREWTFDRVLATFPRLSERLDHGGQRDRYRHLDRGQGLATCSAPHRPGAGDGEGPDRAGGRFGQPVGRPPCVERAPGRLRCTLTFRETGPTSDGVSEIVIKTRLYERQTSADSYQYDSLTAEPAVPAQRARCHPSWQSKTESLSDRSHRRRTPTAGWRRL